MLSWPAFNSLVEQLLERGCTYFVCAGTYSEELHDRLDDIISSTKQKSEICTTFHNDDSLDDVVNFFVFTSDLSDLEHGGIVAMLKMSVREDRLIKDLLLTS
ncbi:MAG: DUF7684 family protein [Telluria sp.]